MTGYKDFFEGRVKIEKDALSEGVTEKDTMIGFGIDLVGRIGTQCTTRVNLNFFRKRVKR